jgi:hypothetical protein
MFPSQKAKIGNSMSKIDYSEDFEFPFTKKKKSFKIIDIYIENDNILTNSIIGGETSNILWYILRTCLVALGQFPH